MLNEYEIFRLVAEQKMSREEALLKLRELAAGSVPAASGSEGEIDAGLSAPQRKAEVKNKLIEIIGGLLHIPAGEFEEELSFKDMGIDSINGVEIVRDINAAFQTNLDAVALYDYSTLLPLTGRIHDDMERSRQANAQAREASASRPLSAWELDGTNPVLPLPPVQAAGHVRAEDLPMNKECPPPPPAPAFIPVPAPTPALLKLKPAQTGRHPDTDNITPYAAEQRVGPVQDEKEPKPDQTVHGTGQALDIAVIGMSGRFPGADTVDELWDHLQDAGSNPIRQVPDGRWTGKQYSGGFLDRIDRFDPLFFNLTPLEAESMDPQHRIFLEETWKAFEDAGYTTGMLDGIRCGVFVGAAQGDYREILRERGLDQTAYAFTGLNTFMLTGRVSYALNLNGPNMAIDTACSSSLVAIHQACESLASGESEMAVAGGIRLILTPDMHKQIEDMDLLSEGASCRSFDRNADGLVLSEGAGVVILKPLAAAVRDEDYIYGVIKGSGVNQDGRSNGITAPSAQAQTRLETEVYERFGIDPQRIGLVEGNGTGTPLGDSIEFKAIRDAFRQYTDRTKFCALGSAKASIGHTTMAAGVTGVIKALLSFKHGMIPPMPNFREPNDLISLEDSPFFINTNAQEWKAEHGMPRMAAVSSFGLSGTNAHLVLEEAPAECRVRNRQKAFPYYLIPLSAKTADALKDKAVELTEWLSKKGRDTTLGDIAYTLSAGRNHYPVRTAVVAADREDLVQQLKFYGDKKHLTAMETGQRSGLSAVHRELCGRLVAELPDVRENDVLFKEKLDALAELYEAGADADWKLMYAKAGCRRVPMPAYPFARTVCWPPRPEPANETESGRDGSSLAAVQQETGLPHPYLHRNTSTLRVQQYTTNFSGTEQVFADHRVQGTGVLPGVVYLEMARAAGEAAGEAEVAGLENILWSSPVTDEMPSQVHTALYPDSEGRVDYEIYSVNGSEPVMHSQGRVVYKHEVSDRLPQEEWLDLPAARLRCGTLTAQTPYYASLAKQRLVFGSSLQAICSMELGEKEAVAELDLSALAVSPDTGLPYPIALLDAAFETVAGLMNRCGETQDRLYLPFALERVDFLEPALPNQCFIYAASEQEQGGSVQDMRRFKMLLLNAQGKVLVRFHNFTVRAFEEQPAGHNLQTV